MPNSSGWLTAVVVSGGKQYRVAPGDRILVDRVAAEPGAEIALDRVLLLQEDGEKGELKVGTPALEGVAVAARVIGHTRGPKIDVLRYKPKKRVRVHRGSRADLTALEILAAPGQASGAKGAGRKRGAARPAAPASVEETSAAAATPAATTEAAGASPSEAPKRPARAPRPAPGEGGEPAGASGQAKPRARRAKPAPQEEEDGA